MRVRSRFVLPLLAAALSVGIAPALIAPPMAHAAGGDDTPTLLNVKGEHENGDDESSFDKLRDAYYWSRLLAGDDAAHRAAGRSAPDQGLGAGRRHRERERQGQRARRHVAGPGPEPDRADRPHHQHLPGGERPDRRARHPQRRHDHPRRRAGRRLDLRRHGRHLDLADQGRRHPVGRRPRDRPEQRHDRLHGLRRGRPLRRLLLRRRRLPSPPTAASRGPTSRPSSPGSRPRPSPSTRRTRTTCMQRRCAAAAATTARPPRPSPHTGSGSPPTAARTGPCARAPTTSCTAPPTWSWTRRTRRCSGRRSGATGSTSPPTAASPGPRPGQPAARQLPRGRHPVLARASRHPAGQANPTIYTGFDYFDNSDVYHAVPRLQERRRRHDLDRRHRDTADGPNSVVGYCGTQCFYDNVVKPDPTNPNIVYALGVYGYNNSPQSGGIYRSIDGGANWLSLGLRPAPGLPRHRVPAEQHPAHRHRQRRRRLAVAHQGGRLAAGDPLSATDWENLNGTVEPDDRGPGPLDRPADHPVHLHRHGSASPRPVLGWHAGQRHAAQVDARTAGGSTRRAVTAARSSSTRRRPTPSTRRSRPTCSAPTSGSARTATTRPQTNTFFGNEAIDGGINLKDRAEFYVPWVQNRGNVNQMFLGTYRLYRTDNAEAPSGRRRDLDADQRRPHQRLHRCRPQRRPRLLHLRGRRGRRRRRRLGRHRRRPRLGQPERGRRRTTRRGPASARACFPNRPVDQIAVDRSNWRIAYVAFGGFGAATPGNTRPRLHHHQRRQDVARRHRQPARRPGQLAS